LKPKKVGEGRGGKRRNQVYMSSSSSASLLRALRCVRSASLRLALRVGLRLLARPLAPLPAVAWLRALCLCGPAGSAGRSSFLPSAIASGRLSSLHAWLLSATLRSRPAAPPPARSGPPSEPKYSYCTAGRKKESFLPPFFFSHF